MQQRHNLPSVRYSSQTSPPTYSPIPFFVWGKYDNNGHDDDDDVDDNEDNNDDDDDNDNENDDDYDDDDEDEDDGDGDDDNMARHRYQLPGCKSPLITVL